MSAILGALGGNVLGEIVKTVGGVIDDLHTSDEERQADALEYRKLDQSLMTGQIETNKEEAKHASIFVAGWRSYIGWICGTALGLVYIPKALVMTGIWTYAAIMVVAKWNGVDAFPVLPEFPDLGVADLVALIFGMLGMAGLRTTEKIKGVARDEPLTPFKVPNPFRKAEQEAP